MGVSGSKHNGHSIRDKWITAIQGDNFFFCKKNWKWGAKFAPEMIMDLCEQKGQHFCLLAILLFTKTALQVPAGQPQAPL